MLAITLAHATHKGTLREYVALYLLIPGGLAVVYGFSMHVAYQAALSKGARPVRGSWGPYAPYMMKIGAVVAAIGLVMLLV